MNDAHAVKVLTKMREMEGEDAEFIREAYPPGDARRRTETLRQRNNMAALSCAIRALTAAGERTVTR